MNILFHYIMFLVLLVIGFAASASAVVCMIAIGVYTYKAAKLLIALLHAAIKEPEEKIVKKVRTMNALANNKINKSGGKR